MSDIQTSHWINKSEQEVTSNLGSFKKKEKIDTGYRLSFDYSTYRIPNNKISTNYNNYTNTRSFDNKGNLLLQGKEVRPTISTQNFNSQLEVINLKYLEFYFDQKGKVSYVVASGYPDSIRYELRKK
jgi:hypothetical protein